MSPASISLSETDVVRDKDVRAGERERFLQWRQLVVHQLDAGAEGRLKELRIGCGDGVPLERVQVSGEVARRVDALHVAEAVRFGLQNAGAEFQLPEHLEIDALVVVVDANEPDACRVSGGRRGHDLLDEPLPVAHLDDVAGMGRVPRDLARCEERAGRGGFESAMGLEQSRGERGAGAAGVVDAVLSAGDLEFVAGEDAE